MTVTTTDGELQVPRFADNLEVRRRRSVWFKRACATTTWLGVSVLFVLIAQILTQGLGALSLDFLSNFASRFASKAGIYAGLIGTLWLIVATAAIAVPVGVASAVYLEEYAARNRLTQIIDINIANLAGVPSIVYGLLGLTMFVRWMSLGTSVISAALTMSLLVLPVIITAAREALRAVPDSLRQAAFGIGATRWQTVFYHVLPQAVPGIMTGVILAMSRSIGETAPLIMVGLPLFIAYTPAGIDDTITVLPLQIFNWAQRPDEEFHSLAAGGIIVLLAVLLFTNLIAVLLRQRGHRES